MDISKLDTYGNENVSQKFTKPLRGVLGGNVITLSNDGSVLLNKIYNIGQRILAGLILFTIGLVYTIPAAVVILTSPKRSIQTEKVESDDESGSEDESIHNQTETEEVENDKEDETINNQNAEKEVEAATKIQSHIRAYLGKVKFEKERVEQIVEIFKQGKNNCENLERKFEREIREIEGNETQLDESSSTKTNQNVVDSERLKLLQRLEKFGPRKMPETLKIWELNVLVNPVKELDTAAKKMQDRKQYLETAKKKKIDAVIDIQSGIRGFLAREELKDLQVHNEAATVIQSHIRGFFARKELENGKAAIAVFEAEWKERMNEVDAIQKDIDAENRAMGGLLNKHRDKHINPSCFYNFESSYFSDLESSLKRYDKQLNDMLADLKQPVIKHFTIPSTITKPFVDKIQSALNQLKMIVAEIKNHRDAQLEYDFMKYNT